MFNPNPRIGFLSHARQLMATGGSPRVIFNDRLDAVVTGFLIVLVGLVLLDSAWNWIGILSRRRPAGVKEAAYVPSVYAQEEK
jgi:hypothetical protein